MVTISNVKAHCVCGSCVWVSSKRYQKATIWTSDQGRLSADFKHVNYDSGSCNGSHNLTVTDEQVNNIE